MDRWQVEMITRDRTWWTSGADREHAERMARHGRIYGYATGRIRSYTPPTYGDPVEVEEDHYRLTAKGVEFLENLAKGADHE